MGVDPRRHWRSVEAEQILRDAVQQRLERVHGQESYEVAVNLNNIAAIVARRGDLAEAESLYRRALAVKEAVLDPLSPEIGITLNNLGLLLKRAGRLDEAAACYERAIRLFEAGLAPGHPNLEAARRTLDALLRASPPRPRTRT